MSCWRSEERGEGDIEGVVAGKGKGSGRGDGLDVLMSWDGYLDVAVVRLLI